MELRLSVNEVGRILLEWSEKNFPMPFDEFRIETEYGRMCGVTLTSKEQEAAPDAQS